VTSGDERHYARSGMSGWCIASHTFLVQASLPIERVPLAP